MRLPHNMCIRIPWATFYAIINSDIHQLKTSGPRALKSTTSIAAFETAICFNYDNHRGFTIFGYCLQTMLMCMTSCSSRLHYLEVCNTYSVHWGNLDDNFRRAVRANACVIGVTRTSFRIVSTTSTASDSVIWIDPLNPSNTCKCSMAREESFVCPRHSEMTPRWQLIKMLKTGQNAFCLQVKTLDLWTLKKFKH